MENIEYRRRHGGYGHPSYPADSPRSGFGTPHGEELPYVFRQLREHNRPAPTPVDEAMSDMMRTYWTNFAKSCDPNGDGLPRWPGFSRATPQMLYIASGRTQAGPIVNEAGLKALDEYFASVFFQATVGCAGMLRHSAEKPSSVVWRAGILRQLQRTIHDPHFLPAGLCFSPAVHAYRRRPSQVENTEVQLSEGVRGKPTPNA